MLDLEQRYVCSLTPLMRARLLCGLYSARVVPPRWRPLARAYCVCVFIFLSYLAYSLRMSKLLTQLYALINLREYLLAFLISFSTGEEYLGRFFIQNDNIDVTLDSRAIFTRLQKQLNMAFILVILYFTWAVVVNIGLYHILGFEMFLSLIVPSLVIEVCTTCAPMVKLMVLALFTTRMLILKRRLQRYGFRARAPHYCQLYEEVWEGLDATDHALKISVFFDLLFSCGKIISRFLTTLNAIVWQDFGNAIAVSVLYFVILLVKTLVLSFGHVVLLEAAATHCEDMAVFTATQLIKNPTTEERARMRAFLAALERRGARYRLLHALNLDARLVLQALNFCSAQIFVFANLVLTSK